VGDYGTLTDGELFDRLRTEYEKLPLNKDDLDERLKVCGVRWTVSTPRYSDGTR
jgi:hypothetical protein